MWSEQRDRTFEATLLHLDAKDIFEELIAVSNPTDLHGTDDAGFNAHHDQRL